MMSLQGIHLFARQNAIVMNSGKPGYLQFMSIDNGKLLYNVRMLVVLLFETL